MSSSGRARSTAAICANNSALTPAAVISAGRESEGDMAPVLVSEETDETDTLRDMVCDGMRKLGVGPSATAKAHSKNDSALS